LAPSHLLQLALIDGLFLCLVIGVFLWFRAWMRQQQDSIDERLKALDEQQQSLGRLGERLQAICRSLESGGAVSVRDRDAATGSAPPRRSLAAPGRDSARTPHPASPRTDSDGPGSSRRTPASPPPTGWRSGDTDAENPDDIYVEARDLLRRGMAPTEVARRLGMGIAEVNALQRIEQSR